MSKKHNKKQFLERERSIERSAEKFPLETVRETKAERNEWKWYQLERKGWADYIQYINYASRPGSKKMFRRDAYRDMRNR